jgi:hypothetical protein
MGPGSITERENPRFKADTVTETDVEDAGPIKSETEGRLNRTERDALPENTPHVGV